jgi:hypothetical protein
MLVRVVAENDTNGNPRRGWIQLAADGNFIKFIDEGYEGHGAIRDLLESGEVESITVNIAPKEYKRFKNLREAGQ